MEKNNVGEPASTVEKPAAINYRGVKAMPFIVGNETFEKIGTTGTLSNLMVYLSTVFNMKNITAATLINVFNGTSNMAPLLGAFLSDSYFGRYKTLAFGSISSLLVYAFFHFNLPSTLMHIIQSFNHKDCISTLVIPFKGMAVLTLTAAISKLHPPTCSSSEIGKCIEPTTWQLAFLLSGFGFLVIGAGGIRPCNLAFGADQFDPNTESGQKGINSFFNWYYCTFTFAMMVSVTVIVYIQSSVSWAIGLAIPTSLMFFSCIVFFLGSKMYVKVKPEGSPLTWVAQVLVAATKKRHLNLPEQPSLCLFNYMPTNSINSKLPYTDNFKFLNKSAIITTEDQINPDGSAADPWRLCSMQQVEEVKCVVRVIPIWASAIIYHVAMAQQQTYAVLQAFQSDRRLGSSSFKIPAASYTIFIMLSLTLWIPINDRFIVASLRRLTGKQGGITLLQRMGIGIVLSSLTMLVSGLVEEKRRHLALTKPTIGISTNGGPISSMSGLWLIPQLVLTGLSDGFNSIGQMEFYYKQFPENMRSVAGAFFFCGAAGSSYLSGFLVSIVHHFTSRTRTGDWLPEDLNRGKLDYFYYMIAALGFLNFGYFLVCAQWYRYKGEGESAIELKNTAGETEKHFV